MPPFAQLGPSGHERVRRAEITQNACFFAGPDQRPHHQKRKPHRRQQIPDGTVEHVESRHGPETTRIQQAQVLKVALTPATVALNMVDKRLRCLFVTAPDTRQKAHAPASPTQQTSFDEIVAHDELRPSAPPLEIGQTGAGRKGRGADDRVVTPIVAFMPGETGDAFGESRAVDARSKLLHPAKNRLRPDKLRKTLDQASARVTGQRVGQAHNGATGHQAVGIQHQHGLITATPVANPIRDIAHLAVGIFLAAAIVKLKPRRQNRLHGANGFLLFAGDFIVARVRQDEHCVSMRAAPRPQLFQHGPGVPQHVPGHFVIDRHQECDVHRLGHCAG